MNFTGVYGNPIIKLINSVNSVKVHGREAITGLDDLLRVNKIRSPVTYSLVWQAVMLLPVFFLLVGFNLVFAYSFLLGAAVFVVANMYFTAYASRAVGVQSIHWMLKKVKQGQLGKFVLSAVGFASVFYFFKPLAVVAVFFGFFFMVLLQWFIAAKLVAGRVFYPKVCK